MLTIAHANVHHQLDAVRRLRRTGADSIGLNESGNLTARLAAPRYRLDVVRGTHDRRSTHTSILTRRRHPAVGQLALQVARESMPARIAPARYAVASLYRHPGGVVAHVSTHLDYIGRAHDNPRTDRVQATDEAARKLLRLIRFLRAQGAAVVVTGDMNIPRGASSPGWLTAWETFHRGRLTARQVGRLDAVAWDPDRLDLAALDVIPRGRLGSDHPGLVARLRPR